MKSNAKIYRNLAIILGLIGLLAISSIGQVLYVISLISVIGIPLAFVILAIPALAIVFVSAYLIWRFIPPFKNYSILVSILTIVVLMLVYPLLHNMRVKSNLAGLISNDVGPASVPSGRKLLSGKSFALVSKSRRALTCNDLCLHLLMSYQASSVLMSKLDKHQNYPDSKSKAFEYKLQRRSQCPEFTVRGMSVRPHSKNFREKKSGTIGGKFATMIDNGYCIIADESKVANADTTFMVLPRNRFSQPSSWTPIQKGIKATRAGIYQYDSNSGMRPIWQHTSVDYTLLEPILLPMITVSPGLSGTSAGWWRKRIRSDSPKYYRLRDLLRASGLTFPANLK